MLEQMFPLGQAEIHEASARILGEEILRQSSSGFDYVKYRQAIQGLLSMNMDEQTAVKSTLTTAATMGVSSKDILESAHHFMEMIESELEKFDVALKVQYKRRVESVKANKILTEDKIKINEQKIIELQKENEILKSELLTFDQQIQDGENFINEKKDQFHITVEKIKSFIEHDLDILHNQS